MSEQQFLLITGCLSNETTASHATAEAIDSVLRDLQVRYTTLALTNDNLASFFQFDFSCVSYVFIATHGGAAENGMLQSFLETINVPFNGANALSSAIGMNKYFTKLLAHRFHIPTARSVLFSHTDDIPQFDTLLEMWGGNKLIVKPNSQGCSIGVQLVSCQEELQRAYSECLMIDERGLIEEFIEGLEVSAFHLQGEVLPLVAANHEQQIFNYEAKFSLGKTTFYTPDIDEQVELSLIQHSDHITELLAIEDYCRLDFIIRDEKSFLLEINTLPALVASSVFVQNSYLTSLQALIINIVAAKQPTAIADCKLN